MKTPTLNSYQQGQLFFNLFVGLLLFVATTFMLRQCQTTPTPTPQISNAGIPTLIEFREDLCAQELLRDPGGLSSSQVEVCYVPGVGWIEKGGTGRLTDKQYYSVFTKLYNDVRHEARMQGVYNNIHNETMYLRWISQRERRDSYGERE